MATNKKIPMSDAPTSPSAEDSIIEIIVEPPQTMPPVEEVVTSSPPKIPKPAKSTKVSADIKKRPVRKQPVPKLVTTAPVLPEPPKKQTMVRRLGATLRRHSQGLALVSGILIVSLWTILRTITNGVNFDVVGQIGVAEQWAQGLHSSVQFGSTNYLLKLPFYIVVNSITFLSPHLRLLLLALLFNIATFTLLFLLFRKIRQLLQITESTTSNLAFIWLASIAGNLFWVDYANSRNLETVGGLWFLYMTIKLAVKWRWSTIAAMVLGGSVIFFADPLQWYVCGTSVIVYALLRLSKFHTKTDVRYSLSIITTSLLTLCGAKLLQALAKSVLHISILAAPNSGAGLQIHNIGSILKSLVVSTAESFDAHFWQRPFSPNTGRQFINAVIALALLIMLLRLMYTKRKKIAYAPWLFVTAIVLNYAVYVGGGQVLVAHTSRYLIMVPLLLVMIIAAASDKFIWPKLRKLVQITWLLLLIVSVVLLVGALAVKWPTRYAKDNHITTLISFLQQRGYHYALAGRETGITTTYFSHGNQTVIPMGCAGGVLSPNDLFYDTAGFDGVENYKGDIPILLQNNEISFGTQHCGLNNIILQFGVPKQQIKVPGYGIALVYKSLSLHSSQLPASLKPIAVVTLPSQILNPTKAPTIIIPKLTGCTHGTTDVIIAHPDDDLLFMNPILAKQFGANCIRTVYVTAADDGRSMDYWLGRQHGVEAAYALMAHADDNWVDEQAIIDGHTILVRGLKSNPAVSLMFLRLPDGNVHGQGFPSTGSISLEKASGNSTSLPVLGSTESYSYKDVVQVVSSILVADKPSQIFSHISGTTLSDGDHSDHRAVGALVIQARVLANSTAIVSSFVGYPLNFLVKNLSPDEIAQKKNIFDIYAIKDGEICNDSGVCNIKPTYGRYLERCYVFSIPALPEPLPPADLPSKQTTQKLLPKPRQNQSIINLFKL